MRWHVHYESEADFTADKRAAPSVDSFDELAAEQFAVARQAASALLKVGAHGGEGELHVHLQGYSEPAPGIGLLIAGHPGTAVATKAMRASRRAAAVRQNAKRAKPAKRGGAAKRKRSR